MGTAQVTTQERTKEFNQALKTLLLRDEDPVPHPKGKLRMENVLDLARMAGCSEAAYTLRSILDDRGVAYGSVDDSVVGEVCEYLKPLPRGVPDLLNEEIQGMIDLAAAAGYKEEVEWMIDVWGDHAPFKPVPSSA